MTTKKWLQKNIGTLANKNVIVTGATGGLGQELCYALAYLNANIFLACRSEQKANSLKNNILQKYPQVSISYIQLDQTNTNHIDLFLQAVNKIKNIHAIFFNAGIYNVPVKKLDNGYNNIFNVNFVSVYHMIKRLLPKIKKDQTKIIAVGSVAHNYSKINVNDVDFSTHTKPSKIYGNSKRFLMFSLYELAKKENFDLSIVHPGITLTNMTNHYPKAINWLVKIGIKLLFPSPQKAVLNLIYGLNNQTDYHMWIGPKLFNIWGKPKRKKLKTCSPSESEQIYLLAEKIVYKPN